MSAEPLAAFFTSYSNFTYNSAARSGTELRRLARVQGWSKGGRQARDAKSAFGIALIQQFNASYGTDASDLANWHALMIRMGIGSLPNSIQDCRKLIKGAFVNIVDLVDARGDPNKTVRLFETERALSVYTKRTGKFFPKDEAKAGGILRFLLRQIDSPRGTRK